MTRRADVTEDTEARWLALVRSGSRTKAIASRSGYSLRRVQLGVSRARLRELTIARNAAIQAERGMLDHIESSLNDESF